MHPTDPQLSKDLFDIGLISVVAGLLIPKADISRPSGSHYKGAKMS